MGGKIRQLTESELEILDLLNSGNYTFDDILNSRQISRSYLYRVIRNINKNGWKIDIKNIGSQKGGHVSSQIGSKIKKQQQPWRYHNLHFLIKRFYKFPRYEKHIGSLEVRHGNWLVSINKNSVEFQLRKNHNIKHKDRWECIRLMREDFNKKLAYVSNMYGFDYTKEKKTIIKCVNGHLAQENSDIAEGYRGNHLLIFGKDGKAWFEIDMSDLWEHEYRHGRDHVDDAETVEKYFNDLRDNSPPTLSEVQTEIFELLKIAKNNQDQLSFFAEHYFSHAALIKGATEYFKVRQKEVKKLKKKAGQTRLDKFI